MIFLGFFWTERFVVSEVIDVQPNGVYFKRYTSFRNQLALMETMHIFVLELAAKVQ